ncbi:MAG: 50S ribosomal protein L18 [Ignavibacteriaceae bacterium]|jgi:ribosomal protein L18, bacterial type|nr:MAG: 50S ribosomal protein L18 [Chlorobiota bacterium]KXK06164.1 MAG: 50S ribosomal protein L18 [Chlorobi bacterium OLB4]MBV6398592.1 50S ribosomal protein L18 [Ignavibacteria bacterium]MCC6885827.1 50S ribosomal protein L18 [Ignavibacteriales bacterium]MCE7952978.1 50S ribosomal protein L18 [Chlorobi bacterium CHB7]MDL1887184.1 50S ribosomal protein L18 [Ignavibacteria bacterium CHB1]MEB2329238.1 50S ribosomal protein L18 [Ignavibacteriaceae bacterium]OQY78077.1 MAG: 50S ribosomal protei
MNKFERSKFRKQKIRYRIRKKVSGTPERPRLVVHRSLKNISAQLIDDSSSKTLLTVTSNSKDFISRNSKLTRIDASVEVGKLVAEKAKEINISQVVFDRNGYSFHGRVKSVAEGAREGGLKF